MKTKFPHILAAVETLEAHEKRDLWALADAIARDAYNEDKGLYRVSEVVKELAAHGYPEEKYHHRYLLELGETALAFPKNRRHAHLTFSVHREAGNADLLDWMVKKKKTGKVTERGAVKLRQRWQELQSKRREANMPKPKPRTMRPPTPEEDEVLEVMSETLDLAVQAKLVVKTLREQLKRLDAMGELDADHVGEIERAYDEAATVLAQIKQRLGKSRLSKFPTIEGGKAAS